MDKQSFQDAITSILNQPKVKMADIAAKLDVSERSLYTFVQEHFGTTPGKYLMARRLEEAHAMIKAKHFRTISEVAFELGFVSTAHFSRVFTKKYGCSPSELKASLNNKNLS